MSTTVKAMLKSRLAELGADGLCYPDECCGCEINDLAPCESINLRECKAAKHYTPKPGDEDYDEAFPKGYYLVLPPGGIA